MHGLYPVLRVSLEVSKGGIRVVTPSDSISGIVISTDTALMYIYRELAGIPTCNRRFWILQKALDALRHESDCSKLEQCINNPMVVDVLRRKHMAE